MLDWANVVIAGGDVALRIVLHWRLVRIMLFSSCNASYFHSVQLSFWFGRKSINMYKTFNNIKHNIIYENEKLKAYKLS